MSVPATEGELFDRMKALEEEIECLCLVVDPRTFALLQEAKVKVREARWAWVHA